MNINKKINAGILLYAVFVSLVISILVYGFIFYNSLEYRFIDFKIKQFNITDNVNSAIDLVSSSPGFFSGDSINIDLYNDDNEIVTAKKQNWGLFEVISFSSSWKHLHAWKTMMFGENIFVDKQTALYMADLNNYLSLSGKTMIKGDCFLPKLGVRHGNVNGVAYFYPQLVYGKVKQSQPNLPELNRIKIDYLSDFKKYCFDNYLPVNYSEYSQDENIFNSFDRPVLVLYSKQQIDVVHNSVKGNIIIISDNKIVISPETYAEDIIVAAPEIEILQGFKGNIQMIATKTIDVADNCVFLYPSAAMLLYNERDFGVPLPQVSFKGKTKFSGSVFVLPNALNKNQPNQVPGKKQEQGPNQSQIVNLLIEQEVILNGQVYCDGNLEFSGKLYGTVFAKKFRINTPRAIYENHLLDAEINFTKLPGFYSGAMLFNDLKWIKPIKCLD